MSYCKFSFFLPCSSFLMNTDQTEDHKQAQSFGDKHHFLCRNLKQDKLKNISNENTYTPKKEGKYAANTFIPATLAKQTY